jgi:hypothetical protein
MKLLLLLVPLALAGCETMQSRPPREAMFVPNFDLCYGLIAGDRDFNQAAISLELSRRGEDCTKELPLVQAKIQANQARRAVANSQAEQGMQLLKAARPQPPTMTTNPLTQCETRYSYGVARTTCY